jgi:ADP-ribose pyrophosphatase
MPDPKVLRSEIAFEGRIFNVRVDTLRFEDGTERRLDVVDHAGSYAIIASPEPGRIVLVRQYRHPAQKRLWEIPAGMAEPSEDLRCGALRELREETGYDARTLRALGALFVTPGFCTEVLHFFFAEDLVAGKQQLDDDEVIDADSFTLDETRNLVACGEIADAKTVLALMWMAGDRKGSLGPL